jgi:hypothetical protein
MQYTCALYRAEQVRAVLCCSCAYACKAVYKLCSILTVLTAVAAGAALTGSSALALADHFGNLWASEQDSSSSSSSANIS